MKRTPFATALVLLALGIGAAGSASAESPAARAWKVNRLMNPGDGDRAIEAKGRVMIYSGLTDREVELAMDEHFDRIENMMFVRTVVTDDEGQARRVPQTNELVVESDGCD